MSALDTPIAIRKLAMDLLAMREHSAAELKRKLLRKGAHAELIDAVLEQLIDDHLLSDDRYLEAYIYSRANTGYGPIRIQQELIQRGIKSASVERALRENSYDWSKKLNEIWLRKFGAYPKDPKEKAKQGRFLLYRGFSMEAVSKLLNKKDID